MNATVLIAAPGWELLIKIGIPLLIAGFSLAMHLYKLAGKNPGVPVENPPDMPRPPRKNPDLSDEVEAFLKSVQQRQGQGGQRQGGQGQGGRQAPAMRGGSARTEPVQAEIVEAQIVEPAVPTLVSRGEGFGGGGPFRGEGATQEVKRFEGEASNPEDQIDQADERMAEQIHSTFDHQLGQFDASQASSDDDTQATSQADDHSMDMATDLRRMLSDPRDIRRAIVLNEILNPPLERW